MAKNKVVTSTKTNDGKSHTSGFGSVTIVIPDDSFADAGSRPMKESDFAAWVKNDMNFKEFGTARPKYS